MCVCTNQQTIFSVWLIRHQPDLLLVLTLTLLLIGCGIGGPSSSSPNHQHTEPTGSRKAINHIIYMLQENQSFDHYFSQLNAYREKLGLSADVDVTPANALQIAYDHSTTFGPFH